MRQNERQELPRPPQEGALKSGRCDTPPALLTCSGKPGPESALASLEVMGNKSSKRHGGSRACQIPIPLLGGSSAVLALIFPHFFAFVFNIDFSSIFFRFRKGFGRVLGGQNGPQIEIFGIFLDMLAETLFLVEFCWIFYKIDSQKHRDLRWIFSASFHKLLLQSGDLLNARNLKNSDFPLGKMHIFIKSHFSRSMLKGIEHAPKANGLGRRKGFKNQ